MQPSTIWLIGLAVVIGLLFGALRLTVRKTSRLQQQHADAADNLADSNTQSAKAQSSRQTEVPSGEPLLSKPSITPSDLGAQFIKWLNVEPPHLPMSTIAQDKLTTEYLYLQAFAFDLGAFLKLGDTYEKKVVLDVFWDYIQGAGVYTDTVQLRMLRYTDAVKEANADSFHESLGQAFADICGLPGDAGLCELGAHTVQNIVGRLANLFDHITIELSQQTV